MPYGATKDLPVWIKKYSSKIQRMFLKTFNSVYTKAIKDGLSKKEADSKSFKIASGVVGKNIEKFGAFRYGYDVDAKFLVDKFLGRYG